MKEIGNDKLLDVDDVVECTGLCRKTAYSVMDSTNAVVRIGNRKYVFESDFLAFLKDLSTSANACAAS